VLFLNNETFAIAVDILSKVSHIIKQVKRYDFTDLLFLGIQHLATALILRYSGSQLFLFVFILGALASPDYACGENRCWLYWVGLKVVSSKLLSHKI